MDKCNYITEVSQDNYNLQDSSKNRVNYIENKKEHKYLQLY